MEIPNVGLVQLVDAESGEVNWFNSASKRNREYYKESAMHKHQRIKESMQKSGVDHVKIATNQSYVQPLMNLFKQRESRR